MTAGVENLVRSRRPGDLLELAAPKVLEQAVPLIAVPGVISDKRVTEEVPRLVTIQVCDRTPEEGQSKIGGRIVADPTVGGVDIKTGVVIHVGEGRAPAPAGHVRVAVLQLAERAVAIVRK